MLTERFVLPAGETKTRLLDFTSHGIDGAEIHTFLKLNFDRVPDGTLFAAEKDGAVLGAVLNTGDYTVQKIPGEPVYPEGLFLMKSGGAPEKPGPVPSPLALSDTLEAQKLLSGTPLSPDAEARYVYRARALREGLARGCGIKEAGKLVSFAYIVAENEDSALLGDVFTLPQYRGRGYASACIRRLDLDAAARGKTLWTLTEKENLDFYAALRFVSP